MLVGVRYRRGFLCLGLLFAFLVQFVVQKIETDHCLCLFYMVVLYHLDRTDF